MRILVTIDAKGTQIYTGKEGNMFTYEEHAPQGGFQQIFLKAYLADRSGYLAHKRAGGETIRLYQQTERALRKRFGRNAEIFFERW